MDAPKINADSRPTANEIFLLRLRQHAKNRSPATLEQVRNFFSSGRKFANYTTHEVPPMNNTWVFEKCSDKLESRIEHLECNPFNMASEDFVLDLLSDSGTGKLTAEQVEMAAVYRSLVPNMEMFAYARPTPRHDMEIVFQMIFGGEFNFYPTVQGRAAEKMLLQAAKEAGILSPGDLLVSNRPFDTTKGHILSNGLEVRALTPQTSPLSYYEADSVFLGNIDSEDFLSEVDSCKMVLVTMTDNGGGGQPVSMANYKHLVHLARAKGKLVWLDGCRVFENAVFIKTFESGQDDRDIVDIVQELISLADVATLSFKKMYAHSGGAILISKRSDLLGSTQLDILDASIKRQTTTDYGNGYQSYAGLTGETMVEVMTGLIISADEAITGQRVAQLGRVSCYMRQQFPNFPIIAGGHALYVAANQLLPNIPKINCAAEYLAALIMHALRTRCAAVGFLIYGKRELKDGEIVMTNEDAMDAVRFAIPRNQYSDEDLISRLHVIGKAYTTGLFHALTGGLDPIDYIDDGFYHFRGKYKFVYPEEFLSALNTMRKLVG